MHMSLQPYFLHDTWNTEKCLRCRVGTKRLIVSKRDAKTIKPRETLVRNSAVSDSLPPLTEF
jgi:hypothetical protein